MKGKSIIVMGVSGSGKSTVGEELAKALDDKFIDGDDLHPKANIIKMASGTPLNDHDREPWLERINDAVFSIKHKQETGVIVCSALKKKYRDCIRAGNDNLCFLFLDGEEAVIVERMQQRAGHFMKAEMVKSQFDALERPDNEQDVITLDISTSITDLVQQAIKEIDNLD